MKKSIVSGVLIIAAIICLLLMCWSAVQFGAIDPIEMPGSFIGAALGAAITGVITVILLKGQSAAEEKKERAIKIFEKKLMVYSQFMEHLWGMFSDSEVTREELNQLRNICFQQLVFFLDDEQIEGISKQLEKIAYDIDMVGVVAAGAKITSILKENLYPEAVKPPKEKEKSKVGKNSLVTLFMSFRKENTFTEYKTDVTPSPEFDSSQQSFESQDVLPRCWHFSMYDETQLKVLENDNDKGETILALFELGESWRTGYVKQVQPGNIIFLFKRGGSGYIGAFKAISTEVIEYEEDHEDYNAREDMYNYLNDGCADYAANIIVRPLAFNCKGVGCKSPRRKTIEPINDREAVNYLLTRFSGNDLTEEQKAGMNKFESGKLVNIQDADRAFFKNLVEIAVG
ncbi:hypothetical protein LQZ21_14655 [Treponema sp. TIM-1]|uniref:hypothetical protein n=1 Tax=Treponema sp. TIM-1 TaxID=2898417 RepID=UPI003980F302